MKRAFCLENLSQLWLRVSLYLPPYDESITVVSTLAVKELMFPITRHWHRQWGNLVRFVSKYTIPQISTNSCNAGLEPKEISVVLRTPTEKSSCNMDLRSGSKTKPSGPSRRRVLACHPVTHTATTQRSWGGSSETWPPPFSHWSHFSAVDPHSVSWSPELQ